jgi:uncharacterized membrane protein YbhN (UPF0104 family)
VTATAQENRAEPRRTEPRPPLVRARAAARAVGSWRWLRPVLGAALLALLVARLGTGPFRSGLAEVSPGLVLAALLTSAVSTACSAWRWRLVAARLGLTVRPVAAVAAYYRSQLLNATLPGGVAGDLHRGVRHGARSGAVGLGLRSVGWERVLGQVVQVGLLLALLVAVPTPVSPPGRVLGGAAVLLAVGGLLAVLVARRGDRVSRAVADDVRRVVGHRPTAAAVVLLSLGATAGHATLFVLATRATGVDLPVRLLLVLAVLVLVGAAVPTNVAGWGPREGAAAWAFAAAGGSAAAGVTAAALYGVLALAGTLPGLVLLLTHRGVLDSGLRSRAGGHRA